MHPMVSHDSVLNYRQRCRLTVHWGGGVKTKENLLYKYFMRKQINSKFLE